MDQAEGLVLEEQLRQQRIAQYGPSSEKLSNLQSELLDEEPAVSRDEVQAEGEREPGTPPPATSGKKKGAPHPGRQTLPAHLPRVEKVVACAPSQCACTCCGGETTVIGYEISEVLDVKPAEYFVELTKREKRACKKCEEQGVVAAPLAARIIDKSLVSDRAIIDTLVRKYADHCLAGSYIQADETPVDVQTHDGRGTNHQAYLWQYGTPGGATVFDFRMSRGREGPAHFLDKFEGILQTDAYAAYDRGVGGVNLVHACCWAHARRRFVDAVKLNKQDVASIRAVELMDELFAIDAQARDDNMDHARRHALRQQKALPLLDQIRSHVLAMSKTVLPKSAAG
jgi:transposase